MLEISLTSPRHKWEDNIKVNFKEIRWEAMGYPQLTQDRDKWWTF